MWEISNIKATYIRQPITIQLQLHNNIYIFFLFISFAHAAMIALKTWQATYIFYSAAQSYQ